MKVVLFTTLSASLASFWVKLYTLGWARVVATETINSCWPSPVYLLANLPLPLLNDPSLKALNGLFYDVYDISDLLKPLIYSLMLSKDIELSYDQSDHTWNTTHNK